jgi:hypothetical protein
MQRFGMRDILKAGTLPSGDLIVRAEFAEFLEDELELGESLYELVASFLSNRLNVDEFRSGAAELGVTNIKE